MNIVDRRDKMTIKEIKDFLIMILDKEMEEELDTTNDKEWIKSCIEAKKWLLDKKGIMALVSSEIIKEDIEKYLKESE
jgi:hypothetical protein